MKPCFLFFILLFFLPIFPINATYPTLNLESKNLKNYAFFNSHYYLSYVSKTVDIIMLPSQWNRQEWLTSTTILGGSSVVFLFESSLNNWIVNHSNNLTDSIGDIGNVIGHPFLLVPLTGLTYTYGYYTKSPLFERAGLLALESLILTGITVKGLKMTFQRYRPRETNDNFQFKGPTLSLSEKNQSFPSGHSALAWATATTFALEFKENNRIVFGSYALATFVSISRLFDHAHWVSDVIIGSAIGHVIARYTVNHYYNKHAVSTISFIPILANDLGLAVKLSF